MSSNHPIIGYCKVCGQGRQFIMRDINTGDLFVSCEDCESEWDNPEQASDRTKAKHDGHLEAEFVTMEVLGGHPWVKYVLNP